MQRRWKPAFTLVELLVVVGVIAVLAAFFFPVIARAREKGRQSVCLAQLRQIVVAFGLYAEDYDQQFPPDLLLGRRNPVRFEDTQGLWYVQLQPYLRSLRVLHCPSDNIADALRATSACSPALRNDPRLPALSYGVNQYLVMAWHQPAWQRLRTPAGISRPSQTLLFGDSSEPWTIGFCPETDPHGVRWSHVAYANGPPVCREGYHGGHSGAGHERHIAGSNLAFVDGHARYMPADRFLCRIQGEHLVQRPIIWPDAVSPDGD
jgi:prepilin-type N-terminal cleavage/methylation domain-containing protein/prepilin-type processing-associated H-X9-DG protein